jgi:hypothetical protein
MEFFSAKYNLMGIALSDQAHASASLKSLTRLQALFCNFWKTQAVGFVSETLN